MTWIIPIQKLQEVTFNWSVTLHYSVQRPLKSFFTTRRIALSVCPSVCPLHSRSVSQRLNISSNRFHHCHSSFNIVANFRRGREIQVRCENYAMVLVNKILAISHKQCQIRPQILQNTNRKSYMIYRNVSLSITSKWLLKVISATETYSRPKSRKIHHTAYIRS